MKKLISTFLAVGLLLGICCQNIAFAAGFPPGIMHKFEDADVSASWILLPNGQGKSSISSSTEKKHTGRFSLKLDYEFNAAETLEMAGFVAKDYSNGIPVEGEPKHFGVWVYGNQSGYNINLYLFDSSGESLQYTGGIVDWLGWKYIELDISKPNTASGGNGNRVADYPVSFFQMVMSKTETMENSTGALYFDDLCFTEEKVLPEEAVEKTGEKLPDKTSSEISENISTIVLDQADFLTIDTGKGQETAGYLNDGDLTSGYVSSGSGAEEWAQIALSAPMPVNKVVITPEAGGSGFPADFTISVSEDGQTWKQVVSETGYQLDGNGPQTFSFETSTAKYIKLTSKNTAGEPLQIREIEIYDDMGVNFALNTNGGKATAGFSASEEEGAPAVKADAGNLLECLLQSGAKTVIIPQELKENAAAAANASYLEANGIKVLYEEAGTSEGLAPLTDTELVNAYTAALKDGKNAFYINQSAIFNEDGTTKPLYTTFQNLSCIFEGSFTADEGWKGAVVSGTNTKTDVLKAGDGGIQEITAATEQAVLIDPVQGTYMDLEDTKDLASGEYPMILFLRETEESGTDGFSVKIRDKLALSTAMFIGSNQCYINGETAAVDSNPAVTPKLVGDKTYVPVRFVAEAAGAQVTWSDVAYRATIKKGDLTLNITPGSKTMTVNGQPVYLEEEIWEEDGRIFVPLRMIAEYLNMSVFWDDSGLIIISNQQYLIDEYADRDLITALTEEFNQE